MSYNTRRQTGQGVGMGGKGSPGMYPPRPRMPHQNSYQTSYSSQQSSNYSSQNQGGVQQHPPPQQQQQPPPPSQQSQSQVLPQPPPPPQLPQPPPPQPPQQQLLQSQVAQQQQQSLQVPPPPPPPQEQSQPSPAAVVKNEPPGTPAPGPQMDVDPDKANDGSGEAKPKPWQKKRFPAFKVNKKLRKRKQNARLRKLLQPKNAMMVLHELKAGIKFTFQEHTNALTQTMFVVNAEVDGKVYVGQGLSKPVAKQNAAENALKALLLEKMSDAAMKAQKQDNAEVVEPMQQEVNNGAGSGDSGEGSDTEGAGAPGKPPAPEDDVPWGSLASFALYKLFTEWQNQGTHVPLPVPKQGPVLPAQAAAAAAAAAGQPVGPGAPSPMKKIPENPTDRHPVMLLNQLKPGIQFIEASREGTPPNLTFTMTVTVDGKTYNGVAKNKKEAKKEAAIACLAGSFNIRY